MKLLSKKTKTVLIALTVSALLLAAAVGATMAYYTSTKRFTNEFSVSKPGVAVQEKFNPSDLWVPGEEKSKEVIFHNTGKLDMLLRFWVELDWDPSCWDKDSAGEPVMEGGKHTCNGQTADSVVKLYWNTSEAENDRQMDNDPSNNELIYNFKRIPAADGTVYYYYKQVLTANGTVGDSTKKVLESVKFETDLSNDGHETGTFEDKQINLTIKAETVLADPDAVAEEWKEVSATFTADGVEWSQVPAASLAGAGTQP